MKLTPLSFLKTKKIKFIRKEESPLRGQINGYLI
jgi:hypothetical protein